MALAIGIDLGTTNTVTAIRRGDMQVVSHPSYPAPERQLLRSALADLDGRWVVGQPAWNARGSFPGKVLTSVKRLMGRAFSDPAIQEQLARFPYRVGAPTEGTQQAVAVWLGERELRPEAVAAEVLKQAVLDAQAFLQGQGVHEAIGEAVITVPAYFNDQQRHATAAAAELAGLALKELLPEPTAAAISYGFRPDAPDSQCLLVYDWGGGTFDASIITAAGSVFVEQAKAGDLWLGGEDLNQVLLSLAWDALSAEEGVSVAELKGWLAAMPKHQVLRLEGELLAAVEQVKQDLSHHEEATLSTSSPLLDPQGMAVPISVRLHRRDFESGIEALVGRTVAICRQVLTEQGLAASDVDAILVVGGSGQIPLVKRRLAEAFQGTQVVVHPRPMTAVGEGAAWVAAGLTEKVGTVSRDYGIELEDGQVHVVIPRNEVLPVTTTHTFKTVAEGQRLVRIALVNPDWVSGQKEGVGTVWLCLQEDLPLGTEVAVLLHLDEAASALKVTASLKHQSNQRVSRSFARGGADERLNQEVEAALAKLNAGGYTAAGMATGLGLAMDTIRASQDIVDERTGEERSDQMQQAKQRLRQLKLHTNDTWVESGDMVRQTNLALDFLDDLIPHAQRERLVREKEALERAMETEQDGAMESAGERLAEEMGRLPRDANLALSIRLMAGDVSRVNPADGAKLAQLASELARALGQGNGTTADRLMQEIRPLVARYEGQSAAAGRVATGISL